MAFRMKKPSIIQGTTAHKKALANIQTRGYANKPDGRNKSSAFQQKDYKSDWTDWEESGQEKPDFKYGDYEQDPLTGQWKKVGTKTTTTPGSKKPGDDKPDPRTKEEKDRDWKEYLASLTPKQKEERKLRKGKETEPTSKTEEDVIYKTRRLKTKMPELEGGSGKLIKVPEYEPEPPQATEFVHQKYEEPKKSKKTKKKKVKFNRSKEERKFRKKAGQILKDCGKGFQAVFSSTGEQTGCEPIPDSALAKRGKLTERLVGKKEKYVAGEGEKLYGEDVKEGATVKIKTTRGRRRPPKVKVKIKKKGKNIESTIKPYKIERYKDVDIRGSRNPETGKPYQKSGSESKIEKKVIKEDVYHADKKKDPRKVKYKKVIKVDPTRKKGSKLPLDYESTKKYDDAMKDWTKRQKSWSKKDQKYLLGDPGEKPKRYTSRPTTQRVKEKIKGTDNWMRRRRKKTKQVGERHSAIRR